MDLKKEIMNEQEAQKIIDTIKEDKELTQAEQLIRDNKIEFEYKDNLYRVRLLSLKEKEELHVMRLQKFGELFQDKRMMLETKLIELYKERDIDITKIDDQIRELDAKLKAIKIELGEALAKNEIETILKNYEIAYETLKFQRQILLIQRTNLLSMSIENQLENYVAEYITYLSLDINIEEKWERMFKTFDSFQSYEDSELINRAATRSMLLQYI